MVAGERGWRTPTTRGVKLSSGVHGLLLESLEQMGEPRIAFVARHRESGVLDHLPAARAKQEYASINVGLFKRQQSQQENQSSAIVVGDEDLSTCALVLQKMEEALLGGNDAGIRTSAREIAWAGGVRPPGDLLEWVMEYKMKDLDAKPLDRPWYWLAAIADEANRRGDPLLAGRVGFFLHGWNEHISPKMGVADGMDCGGIQNIPRDAYAKGLGCAVRALAPLSVDDIVVRTSEKAVPVETLLPALSGTLLQLDQAGVAIDPEARSAALQAVA